MPAKSLNKVRKQVVKKKGKAPNLHERSRDSLRLQRAAQRQHRLEKVFSARTKVNQQYVERVRFFQNAIIEAGDPAGFAHIHQHVLGYISSHDEELDAIQSKRRPGRPPSTRETAIKQFKAHVEEEFESGLWMPDLLDSESLALLRSWNGEWASMSTFKYVRVARSGSIVKSAFPPKGAN